MAAHPSLACRLRLDAISARVILFVFLSTFLTALAVSWISIHTIHGHLERQINEDLPAVLHRGSGESTHGSRPAERSWPSASARPEYAASPT